MTNLSSSKRSLLNSAKITLSQNVLFMYSPVTSRKLISVSASGFFCCELYVPGYVLISHHGSLQTESYLREKIHHTEKGKTPVLQLVSVAYPIITLCHSSSTCPPRNTGSSTFNSKCYGTGGRNRHCYHACSGSGKFNGNVLDHSKRSRRAKKNNWTISYLRKNGKGVLMIPKTLRRFLIRRSEY